MAAQRGSLLGVVLSALTWIPWGWCQNVDVNSVAASGGNSELPAGSLESAPIEHPLRSALDIAEKNLAHARQNIRDYQCLLIKRERIQGKLLPVESIQVKCRPPRESDKAVRQPFSVYMKYMGPKAFRGREVLFVEDRDDGKMLVRKGGGFTGFLSMWLDPDGAMAMRHNRHPITEFGIESLLVRLIEVGKHDLQYDECEVRHLPPTRINERDCLGIEVRHPVPRPHFRYHIARIFWDDVERVPIHFEMYDWPTEVGGPPLLLELYSFRDLQCNVGLTDLDFDRGHPAYGFSGRK